MSAGLQFVFERCDVIWLREIDGHTDFRIPRSFSGLKAGRLVSALVFCKRPSENPLACSKVRRYLKAAKAVSEGDFFGMKTRERMVLYLDYENPSDVMSHNFVIRKSSSHLDSHS